MTVPARFCSKCGKEVGADANFCPNCGAAVRKESRPPQARPQAPDLDSLSGPCVLFRSNAGPYNVGAAGKILAKALGKPLSDVTRQMSGSRGVLADAIDAEVVRRIVPELKALGVECLAVPLAQVIRFPEITQLRDGKFTESGLKCEVVTWDGWQLIERAWSDVMLVSCTQLVSESAKAVDLGGGMLRRREKIVTEVMRRTLLDLFLRNPLTHIRMEEGVAGQEIGPDAPPTHPTAYLQDVAKEVMQIVPAVNTNEGVRLLASGAASELSSSVAFTTRQDVDRYTLWLLELLEHGYPVPR